MWVPGVNFSRRIPVDTLLRPWICFRCPHNHHRWKSRTYQCLHWSTLHKKQSEEFKVLSASKLWDHSFVMVFELHDLMYFRIVHINMNFCCSLCMYNSIRMDSYNLYIFILHMYMFSLFRSFLLSFKWNVCTNHFLKAALQRPRSGSYVHLAGCWKWEAIVFQFFNHTKMEKWSLSKIKFWLISRRKTFSGTETHSVHHLKPTVN